MYTIVPPRVLMVCIMYVLLVPPELCDCSEHSPIQTTQKPVRISDHSTLHKYCMLYCCNTAITFYKYSETCVL